jgi:anti-anti-sigma factor
MKKYNIDIEAKESVLFLRPRDSELGPEQAEKLKSLIRERSASGISAIIVNFSSVDYISSVFLSALIEISKELKARNLRLGLAQVNTMMLGLLKVTKLDTIFSIFDDSYQAFIALSGRQAK